MVVYLDSNAQSPILQEVADVLACLIHDIESICGNPSASHRSGRYTRMLIDKARSSIARATGYDDKNIVFTSGGTESVNTVMSQGWDVVLLPATEHLCAIIGAKRHATDTHLIPVDNNGIPDYIDAISRYNSVSGKVLLSISAANNETGGILPYKDIIKHAKDFQLSVHIDASQAFCRIPEKWISTGADFITLSSHKVGGLPGTGAILIGEHVSKLSPLICGGGQQLSQRAGSENVLGIVAFGAAVDAYGIYSWDKIEDIRNDMEKKIKAIAPEVVIFCERVNRLPNTSCFAVPGWNSELLQIQLDLKGFMVSRGSACSTGTSSSGYVIDAMHNGLDLAQCALRISMSPTITNGEIADFVENWEELYKRWRKKCIAI